MVKELAHFPLNKKLNLLDIGVGSGCILLSILKEKKELKLQVFLGPFYYQI